MRCFSLFLGALLLLSPLAENATYSQAVSLAGQEATTAASDPAKLTLKRIFADKEFNTDSFGPYEWLDGGDDYTSLVPGPPVAGQDDPPKQLVKYNTQTGEGTVLVTAAEMTPAGAGEPLDVDDYDWSEDKSKLLLFANTVKVWRDNTKGDYWVFDMNSRSLRQIAKDATPSTLMFAKFSPNADKVGYVRENNIYVEDLQSGETTTLTSDGTVKLINGTFDWVYEEELGLQDGFRFSPDGNSIAYWQLDSNGIEDFYMINNTDETYPRLIPLPYPKVGTTNSACRIGVVPVSGGQTAWMKVPGEPRANYLASLEWVGDSKHLLLEQLNRLQNTRTLWRVDAASGEPQSIFVDRDDAWVDVRAKFEWYKSDSHRLVLSETDGWRHAYRVSVSDGTTQLLTPGEYDVINLLGIDAGSGEQDATDGWLYFTASPKSAIHQYLYRVPRNGGPAERVTPEAETGFHKYDVAPNGRWAIHTVSRLDQPPTTDLIALPSHQPVRMLEENKEVQERYAGLEMGVTEFFTVDVKDESGKPFKLDGWMIKPPSFDATKKYPVVVHVYTEPWGQTARDTWLGRNRGVWHQMLAQQGYVVLTVDNRGTPAPRGRAWRKSIYQKIGIVNIRDQAEAMKQIVEWPFIDNDRVAVWGWSGGGSATLNLMFQHPELYKVGISIAPVGDQKLYDTIYQERYMGLPQQSPAGFEQGSPVTHAKNLQGKLLLIHGTGDDNVHYQNAEVVMNELIRHNRPFDMMSYPNRSHSINEGDNTSLHLYSLMTRYLKQNLPAGAK